ncbi:hypothetical protein SDC9_210613 [bioreactor metagenome]|uniref:Resolvase/invertase-type recombinase catalytic domain-containing protein n=1 Tax=bioreactor metagenome TaxID=1076179 RepID=A0A645JIC1_9ZZZZ
MPRKSKYNPAAPSASEIVWNAGLYIRLSREDGDKEESDSVQNQNPFSLILWRSAPTCAPRRYIVTTAMNRKVLSRPGRDYCYYICST